MIDNFLKLGGVSSVKEFYKKFPSEDDFFVAHPEASFMKQGGEIDPTKPKQPNPSLPNWDGMVQKADGSIGMWGNDLPPAKVASGYRMYPTGTITAEEYTYLQSLKDPSVNRAMQGVINQPGHTPQFGTDTSDMIKQVLSKRVLQKKEMGGGDPNPFLPGNYLATSASRLAPADPWGDPDFNVDVKQDIPSLSFEEQMQRRMKKDMTVIEDGLIAQAPVKKKLGIKDYLTAGVERLQNNSDKFMEAYNDPLSAISMLGYGANIASMVENRRDEKSAQKRVQEQYSSDNMFTTTRGDVSGNRGDYSTTGTSYGQFRPDELGAKSPYGTTGTYYKEGGEYELSQAEILKLIKSGAQIEFM